MSEQADQPPNPGKRTRSPRGQSSNLTAKSERVSKYQEPEIAQVALPVDDDLTAWETYWQAQGQVWRTEPEINEERQKYLATCRVIAPNINLGIFPFKGLKLSRSDIEWLLATHEGGRGPVIWQDESQRGRQGLDLRGADLSGMDLSYLPLAGLRGGFAQTDWMALTIEPYNVPVIHLEGANLTGSHLESATLGLAHLEGASLCSAWLQNVYCALTHLEGADLREAHLEQAYLGQAHLEGSDLRGAHLEGADLWKGHLGGKMLAPDELELEWVQSQEIPEVLSPADLRGVFFNNNTNLEGTHFGDLKYGSASLAGVQWENVNLAVVDWKSVKTLGEEVIAQQKKTPSSWEKGKSQRSEEYQAAILANRQLAMVLQMQGLREEARHFAYRSQLLRWQQLRLEGIRNCVPYIGSLWFYLLAGFGYKPLRSILSYLCLILGFASVYYFQALMSGPSLSWYGAVVISLTAFHGRGFFPEQFRPGDPQSITAALESALGLVVEITLIVLFVRRDSLISIGPRERPRLPSAESSLPGPYLQRNPQPRVVPSHNTVVLRSSLLAALSSRWPKSLRGRGCFILIVGFGVLVWLVEPLVFLRTISSFDTMMLVLLITGCNGFWRGWLREVITTAILLGSLFFLLLGGQDVLYRFIFVNLVGAFKALFSGSTAPTSELSPQGDFLFTFLTFLILTVMAYIVGHKAGKPPTSITHRLIGIIPAVVNGISGFFYVTRYIVPQLRIPLGPFTIEFPDQSTVGSFLPIVFGIALLAVMIMLILLSFRRKAKK